MSDENEPEKSESTTDSGGEQLILGKFKTSEDLANSYTALEAEFTRKNQELAANKHALEELQRVRPQEPVQEDDEDDDQLFFQQPAKATEKVVSRAMSPIYEFLYEQQKESLRSNPDFVAYEQEIDALLNLQPQMKMKPGIVAQVFKMVKGLHFDPESYKKQVITEHQEAEKARREGKVLDSLEGSAAPEVNRGAKTEPKLSDEEKKVALKFNPGVSAEEAYKKYAEKKVKSGGSR